MSGEPELDLDAIGERAAWVASTGFVVGDNARRLVAEDVPALLALARRLLAERDAARDDCAALREMDLEASTERNALRAVLRPLLEEPMHDGCCVFCAYCPRLYGMGNHADGCPALPANRARLLGEEEGTGG